MRFCSEIEFRMGVVIDSSGERGMYFTNSTSASHWFQCRYGTNFLVNPPDEKAPKSVTVRETTQNIGQFKSGFTIQLFESEKFQLPGSLLASSREDVLSASVGSNLI